MKALFTSLLIVSAITFSSFTQTGNIEAVISALRTGDATELSDYLDDNVELTLPDKANSYSKAQALVILKDFFSNNGVKSFEVKHKGNNGGAQFCIGTLQAKSGNFRTTIFMKIKNNKEVVKDIRFQSME